MARKPLMIKVVQIETAELGLNYRAGREWRSGEVVRMADGRAQLAENSGQVTRHSRLFTSPVDGRSREGRFLGRWRIELKRHLGREPSPVEAEIIDRIAWQKLHLARLDAKAAAGARLSGEEIRLYTSLTSGIVRAMRALGMKSSQPPVPSPQAILDYLNRGAAA
jgi:hypothetical protein